MEALIKIFTYLQNTDRPYRFESDDSGFHLSIVDRKVYPRCWVDNESEGNVKIIEESSDHFLNRELPTLKKDWRQRFEGETIEELVNDFNTNYDYAI